MTVIILIVFALIHTNSKLHCCSLPAGQQPLLLFSVHLYIYNMHFVTIVCELSTRNSPCRMARAIRRPGLATYLHKTNYLLIKAITLISNADLQPGLQTRLAIAKSNQSRAIQSPRHPTYLRKTDYLLL